VYNLYRDSKETLTSWLVTKKVSSKNKNNNKNNNNDNGVKELSEILYRYYRELYV
jgi:hypothetical protein